MVVHRGELIPPIPCLSIMVALVAVMWCMVYITGIRRLVWVDWVCGCGVVEVVGLLSGFVDEMKISPPQYCGGLIEDLMKVKGIGKSN